MGRRKDAIVSAGKTISPSEVEDILCQHSSVQEAGAIGIPDDELGEVIKAVIVLKRGQSVTEEEIINLCRQNLPDYAVPKSVIFVDSLPRSSLGRVLKRVLRDQYSQR